MYPFNSIIAQQEYERLNDVSRDFARGRLHVRAGGPSYSNWTARVRQLGGAVFSINWHTLTTALRGGGTAVPS